ncbi:hypothetical protein DFR58_14610 [Anaerobacterium chartisolvens]|uniref:Uncharacterized protein n=1 Tax=Anaerobacterium chartisolvens TaxID=1297424 RepID=A0A369AG47_9FIRM|nr:hypothetical protein DFR58_14610 [Anaerobacterium chartisolvens]
MISSYTPLDHVAYDGELIYKIENSVFRVRILV